MTSKNLLSEAIETTFASLTEDFHTCTPGQISTFDYKTNTATVQPLLKKVYIDGDVLTLDVLANVPVIFPRTSRSGLTFPLQEGDGVLICFSERALENWKGTNTIAEPGDKRRFDLSDAVCIPGLFGVKQKSTATNNDDLEITHNGFKITITKAGKISIKGKNNLDLVSIIDEWMSQVQNSLVITGIGLQPFDPTSLAAMALIQTKLKEILV